MKYVKIVFRDKSFVNLSITKWEGILNDKSNLVPYMLDSESEWNGRTLNKVEVMYSVYDDEYTKKMTEPKYKIYRNKETNSVIQMLDGELPDEFEKYELL